LPGSTEAPGLAGGGVGPGDAILAALCRALGGSKEPSKAPVQVLHDGSTDKMFEGIERTGPRALLPAWPIRHSQVPVV
jgi:hypothetical protein